MSTEHKQNTKSLQASSGINITKKNDWFRKHKVLLILSLVALLLFILSVVTLTSYPYVNIMLSMITCSIFLYVKLRARAADIKLIISGVRTTATITDKKEVHGQTVGSLEHWPEPLDSYYIAYTFPSSDGKQTPGKHEITESLYKNLIIGHSVDIAFDLADPRRSIPIRGTKELHSFWVIIWNAIMIAVITFVGSALLGSVFN